MGRASNSLLPVGDAERPHTSLRLSDRAAAYVRDVSHACAAFRPEVASIILFGSSVTGGSAASSDVDLVIVLFDAAGAADRTRLRRAVETIEAAHFPAATAPPDGVLDGFARKVTANVRSFFVCTRADFVSGQPHRLLSIPRAQAAFVDRIVMHSIMGSAVTLSGDDLLPLVPLLPIRRRDVFKAFFGLWNQLLLALVMYPFVPNATRYAMATLKRSLHSCYFVYRQRPASLRDEVAFFQERLGGDTLRRLMELRATYQASLHFILASMITVIRLHGRTLLDNDFPRPLEKRQQ